MITPVTGKPAKIALFGENVSSSLSPAMHNAAFRHLGLPYVYEAVSVSPAKFEKKFGEARLEFSGLNITIPYKETAAGKLDCLSLRARKLGAVNTVVFQDGRGLGENTDVDGFIEGLSRTGFRLEEGSRAFVLGAGGAAKAAVEALHSLGVRRLVIANRSSGRLSRFEEWFNACYPGLQPAVLPLDGLAPETLQNEVRACMLFINAAPLEALERVPSFSELVFPPGALAADWVYFPKMTPWLEKGKKAKGTLVPGYKLLLYQGMTSFRIWTGVQAPETVMENALLKELE